MAAPATFQRQPEQHGIYTWLRIRNWQHARLLKLPVDVQEDNTVHALTSNAASLTTCTPLNVLPLVP
jgi:hypothetical protein